MHAFQGLKNNKLIFEKMTLQAFLICDGAMSEIIDERDFQEICKPNSLSFNFMLRALGFRPCDRFYFHHQASSPIKFLTKNEIVPLWYFHTEIKYISE